jgi:putative tryptophan/tyrosine transport system substrate-binding protein
MMDRRRFLVTSLAGAVAAPLAAEAQAPRAGRVYRLGMLLPTEAVPDRSTAGTVNFTLNTLREMGYVEGQNLLVEVRYARGKIDRLPGLARELVRFGAEIIVAVSDLAVQAAREATATIPIIMFMGWVRDPIKAGWVGSLARPGGNITGVLIAAEGTLAGKRVELIKEAVPQAARIALLAAPTSASVQVQEAQKAATSLGVKLLVVEARDGDYDPAFSTMVAERADALFVLASPFFFRDRRRIIELAGKHRLPAIYEWREQADEGGLVAYGSSLAGLCRRVAVFVDRIFNGAKPADLPVEQPTKFELVVNMKTAKTLGLTIPPSLLARADHVIE